MTTKWKKQWNSWLDPRPCLPGVFRRKEGGFLVRARATNPRTGTKKEIREVLPTVETPAEALAYLEKQRELIRNGGSTATTEPPPLFCDYAVSLAERKILTGEIKSAASKEQWASTLEHHLIPAFGRLGVDELRRLHVEAWRLEIGKRISMGEISPHTANGWLRILQVIANTMTGEYELERNPMAGVAKFDTSEHVPFTEEEPNSLTPLEVPRFLELMGEHYPQHFGFVALGFGTGWRPSSLRPLRRKGPTPDVIWDEGVLLIRRSHTRGDAVMETTKTKRRQRVVLPPELMEVLRWHVDQLPEGPMRESELLFPSETGGFRSRSSIDKPMGAVAELMGLKKKITPKAMRRTFQDLCRAASVPDIVTRAVSGHATEAMQRHYSTVNDNEMQQQLGKVVSLFGLKKERAGESGVHGGMHTPEKTTAG